MQRLALLQLPTLLSLTTTFHTPICTPQNPHSHTGTHLRLRDRARTPVEHKARAPHVVLRQPRLEQRQHVLVGHQPPGGDRLPDGGRVRRVVRGRRVPQQLRRADVLDAEEGRELGRVQRLAGADGSCLKKNERKRRTSSHLDDEW